MSDQPGADDPLSPSDVLYDKAAEIAERHLDAALGEGKRIEYLVAVMMIEASVNAAVELTSKEDVIQLLQDLAEQIASDEDDDDN